MPAKMIGPRRIQQAQVRQRPVQLAHRQSLAGLAVAHGFDVAQQSRTNRGAKLRLTDQAEKLLVPDEEVLHSSHSDNLCNCRMLKRHEQQSSDGNRLQQHRQSLAYRII